jgi:hypothetical protein
MAIGLLLPTIDLITATIDAAITKVSAEINAQSVSRSQRWYCRQARDYTAAVALLEPIFEALNRAGVRYVVVGGVAVVLHGFARLTGDLDLAVDLSPGEARKAIDTLLDLGFRSRVPVLATDFADAQCRATWMREKAMRVFPLWDPANPLRQVDLFVENPMPFGDLWKRAQIIDLDTTTVRIASIPDMIAMKRLAGRPQDLSDIEALDAILRRQQGRDG